MERPTGFASIGMLFAIAKKMALRYGVTNIQDIQLDAQNNGIKFILTTGDSITVPFDASEVPFIPGSSGINANNIQDAIYELAGKSTYLPFPASWTTNLTMLDLFTDIENDTKAVVGMAYLGEVTCSDLPFSGNAELTIEIMNGTGTNKVILATLTSADVAPYYWQRTYSPSHNHGWQTFISEDNSIPEFNINTNYALGDLVTYEGLFYKCTTPHSAGNWAAADFTQVNLKDLFDSKQDTLTFDNTPTQDSTNAVTSGGVYSALALKEDVSNKVTSISLLSTDDEYPSAKCVYDAIPTAMSDYEVQDTVWESLYTTYTITVSVTNGTYVGNAVAPVGKTAEIVVTEDSGYSLPASVTVTNATGSWNQSTGKLEITDPTGNVTVTVVCA